MNKRRYRRLTLDKKRMILAKVAQPGIPLSEVCHPDTQAARLQAELNRMRRVGADITEKVP